tara:strand:+ start:2392 stop:2709 length:318 start_codon:yes stop_codon:yes gene_type:complete
MFSGSGKFDGSGMFSGAGPISSKAKQVGNVTIRATIRDGKMFAASIPLHSSLVPSNTLWSRTEFRRSLLAIRADIEPLACAATGPDVKSRHLAIAPEPEWFPSAF